MAVIRRNKKSPKDIRYPFTHYSTRIYSGTKTKVRTTSLVSRKKLKLSTEGGIASGKCSQPDFTAGWESPVWNGK